MVRCYQCSCVYELQRTDSAAADADSVSADYPEYLQTVPLIGGGWLSGETIAGQIARLGCHSGHYRNIGSRCGNQLPVPVRLPDGLAAGRDGGVVRENRNL